MTNFSPLRYPGGKGKLAPYMRAVLEMNGLEGGHYAEPFAGGAAVALDLLFSERVSHIHINDIDPCLFAFWHSAVHQTADLIDRILQMEITVDSWLAAREVKRAPEKHSLLDLGFSTFLLNRTNRSGILNGGMIGGLEQKGVWKLDCRFNKQELIERLKRIGFYRSRISVLQQDAASFIEEYLSGVAAKCLVYIDPPYYVKGAYLYENHYGHEDHVYLAGQISKLSHKWVVSYDNAQQIRRIYSGFQQEQFAIGYSARNHEQGTEVMVFSDGLSRPPNVFSSLKHRRQLATA